MFTPLIIDVDKNLDNKRCIKSYRVEACNSIVLEGQRILFY